MRARQWESRLIVIEFCRRPGDVAMASGAVMAKLARLMVGIRRSIELGRMTAIAIPRRARVTRLVTGDALHRQMCTCKREICVVVIELGRRPGYVVVASQTVMAELICLMVGIRRYVELGRVAAKAVSRSTGIACRMARNTLHRLMCTRDRKIRIVVIELRRRPSNVAVAS